MDYNFLSQASSAKVAAETIRVQNKTHHDIVFPPIKASRLPAGFGDVKGVTLQPGLNSLPARYLEAVEHINSAPRSDPDRVPGLVKAVADAFSLNVNRSMERLSPDMGPALEVVPTDDPRYAKGDGPDAPSNLTVYSEHVCIMLIDSESDPHVLKSWLSTEHRDDIKGLITAKLKVIGA